MARESAARAERRVHATPAPKAVEKGSQRRTDASVTMEAGQPLVDLEFLKGLIEAIDQSSIDTVEIKDQSGARIRIAKTPPVTHVSSTNGSSVAASAPAAIAAAPAPAIEAAPAAQATAPAPKSNLLDVKSPMVGTFYRAPAPEAPSYVEIGSTVRKGQTLCILEAMKLMNELESEVEGVVREILAENADPVEYGQVLFRVEPA